MLGKFIRCFKSIANRAEYPERGDARGDPEKLLKWCQWLLAIASAWKSIVDVTGTVGSFLPVGLREICSKEKGRT